MRADITHPPASIGRGCWHACCQFALLLCLVAWLTTQARTSIREDGDGDTGFIVRTWQGQVWRGKVKEISAEGSVTLHTHAGGLSIAAEDVFILHRPEGFGVISPGRSYVLLQNGDRVPVERVEMDASGVRVRFKAADFAPVTLPQQSVRGIWFRPPRDTVSPEKRQWNWEQAEPAVDEVTLETGDRVLGLAQAIGEGKLAMVSAEGSQELGMNSVACLRLAGKARSEHPRPGRLARLYLSDGSRLTLKQMRAGGTNRLTIETVWGLKATIQLNSIAAVEPCLERRTYLSALRTESEIARPYLDTPLPSVKNGNVRRGWLQVGGMTFDGGLGVAGGSTLAYQLGERYDWFAVAAGLDSQWGKQGAVSIRIRVDEKDQLPATPVRIEDGLKWIGVPVTGAARLELLVDREANGGVGDCFNWAGACLRHR